MKWIYYFIENTHQRYTVPVILKQPSPEIVSQLNDYGPEIPIKSFLDVGEELNGR